LVDAVVAPLAVLAEDWPLRELLVLCFNANLGFFERAGLAKARSRGARVTVVADADMVHADPEAVRFAGRAYLDGRAVSLNGGAFHPKLIVALGEEQAVVLVGSGNASPGGWIENAELWTLLRATAEAAPDTLVGIADFLDALPAQVRFSPGVTDVLTEVAVGLRSFPATEPGPLVVSSIWAPILTQLPALSAVEQLVIACPFHDRPANAARLLCEHFSPTSVEVVVQDATVFDGQKLAEVLERFGGQVARVASPRYHHGKLVEVATATDRWALTGSANASAAALLNDMAGGANCELGLWAPISQSLRPSTAEPEAPAAVVGHEWVPPAKSASQAPAVLLAVILESRGLRLVLRRPLTAPATLEYLIDNRWQPVATIQPAFDGEDPIVEVVLPGAAALRLVAADGTPSGVVWVTDLERTRFRHVPAKRTLSGDPFAIALDPRLVTMVELALATVRSWAVETGPVVAGHRDIALQKVHPTEGWRQYVDGFRSEVGDEFSFFVLPHLMRAAGAEGAPDSTTSDKVEAGEGGGDSESAPEEEDLVAAEITSRLADLDGSRLKSRLRAYRRMCERLTDNGSQKPYPVRIAAAALTVGGVALGCWPSGVELVQELRRSLRPLTKIIDDETFRADAASIAAVSLAILRSRAGNLSDSSEAAMIFRLTAGELRPLLTASDPDDVAQRCAGLAAQGLTQLANPQAVIDLIATIVNPDLIAEATRDLVEEQGIGAEQDDRHIRLLQPCGNAVAAALRVIGLAQDAAPVGAVAAGPKGAAALVWNDPELIVASFAGKRRRVTRFRLTGQLKPNDYARSEGRIPTALETDNWYGPIPDAIEEAFLEVGIFLEKVAELT
jgi:hypothetical protein